jgi:pyruvate,water dikinase
MFHLVLNDNCFDRQNGQPIRVLVGVVIQEMVKSEVSGVLFTNHPVTGSSGHMVIDASYGLGEVSAANKSDIEPDKYYTETPSC